MEKERMFFRVGDDFTYLDKNGFVAHEGYMGLMQRVGFYFGEADIIERINENKDGYFDFSKTLIDIGCEIGVYSQWTKFAYYHMFDGNKDRTIAAQFNMLLREKSDIFEMHNVLLSDKDETLVYDGFCTLYSGDLYNEAKNGTAKATTLDSFNIKNVGLIKMDVEGMEEKVLHGAKNTIISNDYPPILFEAWDVGLSSMTQEKHDRIEKFLQDLGYEVLWHWGDFETHLAIKK